ncbi:hypothetical protein CkaCkLH20_10654 [Colletotrichum karsti]|uniref:Tyrosinase copper-binding domain-containing protein n=1 Tax=Colletotrichum karsti TaxID=1095194 RepID=A0A9P6HVN3_9PEZI|nr:uncharacterized protein CkaCkLH20_10654 [Colletotrichum karsti]KAF9872022.1 hypothetical protein CkaCkLH20_10654 [Colletotrichum karsti]
MWERTLKESCAFHSPIPYWDWTLDWQNLASSSIWDAETGFGGDGTRGEHTAVGGGSCVTDGPFRNLRPKLYNHTYLEHCLSRGFNDTMRRPLQALSPDSIGAIMGNTTYAGFEKRVEFTLHNGLHEAIGGDFKALTAANDPIFFLHHAQVDRLWWRWQREDPAARLYHTMKIQQALALLVAFGEAVSAFPAAGDHAVLPVKTMKPGQTVEDYVGGFEDKKRDENSNTVEDYVGGFEDKKREENSNTVEDYVGGFEDKKREENSNTVEDYVGGFED